MKNLAGMTGRGGGKARQQKEGGGVRLRSCGLRKKGTKLQGKGSRQYLRGGSGRTPCEKKERGIGKWGPRLAAEGGKGGRRKEERSSSARTVIRTTYKKGGKRLTQEHPPSGEKDWVKGYKIAGRKKKLLWREKYGASAHGLSGKW